MKLRMKIKGFFRSSKVIIGALIILVITLLIYTNYLMKSSKTYMFNGTSDEVDIYNGVISLNYSIKVFEGSDITYKGKDVIVTKYKIGYFLKDGDNLRDFIMISDQDEDGFSLKSLIEGISTFNVTELNRNHRFFSKDFIKDIDKGLVFMIEATKKDGDVLSIILPINITKVSK